jgi:hypothetical protein
MFSEIPVMVTELKNSIALESSNRVLGAEPPTSCGPIQSHGHECSEHAVAKSQVLKLVLISAALKFMLKLYSLPELKLNCDLCQISRIQCMGTNWPPLSPEYCQLGESSS